jgi:E3 ubiquitin-protein ligase TRIP12
MDLDYNEDLDDIVDEDGLDSRAEGMMEDEEEYPSSGDNNVEEERSPNGRSLAETMLRNITTMRGLSGMMGNVHGALRTILPNLRNSQDPTMQHIALEELSQLLAISTEETLAGYLAPEPYVVELIKILKGGPDNAPFGDNPDIMLLASRCLANLMEALPQSTGTVVYSGAVPVLCSKLLEIQYIDLAEQALSVRPLTSVTNFRR